jgi:ABC-type nitrate/sulfonate/bicarbonate transport system permease component
MQPEYSISLIINHILRSILPALIGIFFGGGLGLLLGLILSKILGLAPWLQGIVRLAPWRSVAFTLCLILIYRGILMNLGLRFGIRFGIGPDFDMLILGIIVFILSFIFLPSTFLGHYFGNALLERLFRVFRTLIVGSVFLAALPFMALAGSGGMGNFMLRNMNLLNFNMVWLGILTVFGIGLLIDLFFGAIHLIMGPRKVEPLQPIVMESSL